MSIKEYKDKFLELFEQLEEEHGHVKEVWLQHRFILHNELGEEYESNDCEITFS